MVTTCGSFEQLDRELKADHGLSHDDYAHPGQPVRGSRPRLRMTELADRVLESKSRLSHHVGRLEADGLVERAELSQRPSRAGRRPHRQPGNGG